MMCKVRFTGKSWNCGGRGGGKRYKIGAIWGAGGQWSWDILEEGVCPKNARNKMRKIGVNSRSD